ncbi:succinylglutamate desuccinylase/aspartoacylase family protein [Pyruvatibacter sp.]|uniref:succinylglutamate desuccinylase/aspartoacylase family protein n=1 Tax=Pyruvatibacter sp. TaxID=1981328 RepID=UPI0032EEECC1
MNESRGDPGRWGGVEVGPGEAREVRITVSESYSGVDVRIPVYVWRGREEGPTVFVSGAVHGDEINGTGAIRSIIVDRPFEIDRGTLLLCPVVNILGFERHSRYMPDRRDLNRSFPGTTSGSLTSRMADAFFTGVVARCEYGIDLHTAALRRTNFPNVRADMKDDRVADLARAFGAELIVHGRGPRGSLRRAACASGCATIILEAGEVWKVESGVVEYAVRGIRNCLIRLGMVRGRAEKPPYLVETDGTTWIRAMNGGFLRFHVAPGAIVEQGDAIATNASLTGEEQEVIRAARNGIVLGMTTLPSVAPGDPVCHLAFVKSGPLHRMERAVERLDDAHLYERIREDLARSYYLREAGPDPDREPAI